MTPTRRDFARGVSAIALSAPFLSFAGCARPASGRVQPAALSDVRLKPSIFLDAVNANRRYLMFLSPDRLLHNFRTSARLRPLAPRYRGWEDRGIAGHTLGHYLSACSHMHAQTGDMEIRDRVSYIMEELAACQAAHGDGYIGGTTVERDGVEVDGKVVFEELRAGDVRAGPFDVNGGWVPLYTWHKVQAGLIDAVRLARVDAALPVLKGMAGYLEEILAGLSDDQMQSLLACEHGGLNEAFAATYELTGEKRFLAVAERIYHRAVLDPVTAGKDILQGLHANTQIPKFIGLAELYDVTGTDRYAQGAANFHQMVTQEHSYAIGGNAEREHFLAPAIAAHALSDRTCEACNSYNMLKLTRRLYSWTPDAALFDVYERMHLNHIMAHQHPETGRFAYFMPLASGAGRTWSQAEESFWCCVGSGMESHSKHGESIYWTGGDRLYVNLFIPSEFDWRDVGAKVSLDTQYPFAETVRIRLDKAPAKAATLAIRLPGWCASPALAVNGEPQSVAAQDGYAVFARDWKDGDEIVATLPMTLVREAAPDDATVSVYRYGPMVLAADLGAANAPFTSMTPVFINSEYDGVPQRLPDEPVAFYLDAAPAPVTLRPFFNRHDRRIAVYIPTVSRTDWTARLADHRRRRAEADAIDARTIDVVRFGELDDEAAHHFDYNQSDVVAAGGRNGRQAWWGVGNYIEIDLKAADAPLKLRALYWGQDRNKNFTVNIDGAPLAQETLAGEETKGFVAVEYDIPPAMTVGKDNIRVRFETNGTDAPVYECRTITA